MVPHTPEIQERPDEEWQLVREEIAIMRESGLDLGLMNIVERLVKAGHDYRLVFEIMCNDREKVLKHIKPDDLPQIGVARIVDTKLPEGYQEYEKKVPFPLVSLRVLFNERPFIQATRFDPTTLEAQNPKISSEYDSISIKVTPTDTFVGSESVRVENGKPIVSLSSEGKKLERFSNSDVARGDQDIMHRIGAVIGDAYELFPAII